MKMKIPVRRSCISVIILSALVEAIKPNENETSTVEGRQGRVTGRIVKLYSGSKPDPVLCDKEGFKADPIHCAIFYRCWKSSSGKFTIFKFQCGPGTVYDPETEVCNHPSSTKRSECGGKISNVEQDNENEIAQYELPSPISTILPIYATRPNNVTTDVYKTSTENAYTYPSMTSSIPYPIGTTTNRVQDINHNIVSYPWTDYKNTTGQKITSSTTVAPSLGKNQPCISDGFMGDNDICKKFYRCVSNSRGGFIRYEFLCSEPTVWDDRIQSCNHPWAVRNRRCGRSGISNDISTDQATVNYGTKHTEDINENDKDIIKEKDSPPNYSYSSYNYGDKFSGMDEPGDKKNYVNYESPITQSTTSNNKKKLGTEANIHTADVNNFGKKTTVYDIYSTKKVVENTSTSVIDIGKKFICTQSGFVGDSYDCKKFYRCVENGKGSFTKFEFSCSQGTVWDKKIDACNHAWAVKECGGNSVVESVFTTNNLTPINSSTSSTTVFSENVDSGYMNQINQEHQEPPTTIRISTPLTLISTTMATNVIEPKCKVTGFVGDNNDCKKFYRCVDNGRGTFTKYEYKCGDGTLWDQNIEACNHAWAVKDCNNTGSNSSSNIPINVTSSPTPITYSTTNANNVESITTISPLQTPAPQKEISDYDSGYPQQQSVTTKRPAIGIQTTTSKQSLGKKNNCQSTGFIGDIYNCNKFYRCVDNGNGGFIQHEFSCGEGTVWDPEIEACNHAWAVKHCGGSMSSNENILTSSTNNLSIEEVNNGYETQNYVVNENTTPYKNLETTSIPTIYKNNECKSNGFMGDISDCKKFYRCVDSGNGRYIKYEYYCGEGTLWDSQINACNHAWAVHGCESSSTQNVNYMSVKPTLATDEETGGYGTQSNKQPDNLTENTTSPSSTSILITVMNGSNECKSGGFIGDNTDCQKFYRCVDNGNGGFIKHQFLCGEGTVWDSKIEACNHKWAVEKCGSNSINELVETTTQPLPAISPVTQSVATTLYYVDYSSSTTTSIKPSHEDKECRLEGFFANPNDCKKFYRCVNEGKDVYTKYDFSCVDGTVWVQEIQACDYDIDVGNCHTSSNSKTTVTSKNPNVVTNTTPISSLNNTMDQNNVDKHGNDECTSEGYYPSKNNCQQFYRCVDNGDGSYKKYEFSCAEGTAWDVNTQSCNHINKVDTCLSNQHPPNGAEIEPMQDEQDTSTVTTKTTTLASTIDNSQHTEQNICKEEGYFGDTENCKKFYRCVHDNNGGYTKYNYDCGDGTIWDQDITACNHPYDVKNPSCKSGHESTSSTTTIDSSATSTTSETPNSTNKPSSTTSGVPSSNNESTSNCSNNSANEGPNNKNFTCTKAGFYAHPSDCKKFYRCVDWENNGEKFSIYHFDCGDGTIWDPALETCNHKDSVYPPRNCSGTQQQAENTTEISSTTEEITTTTNQGEISTTSEPTKTTQQTTTQQTTTQQTTTQQTTTQQTTTQQATTQQTTTQQATTLQTTTQQTTTQQTTTQQATTQQTTTQQATTNEQSTTSKEPTTAQTTVAPSTTEQSTAETNSQQSTTDSTTTETNQEQTTKSSTLQTTNEETTTTESSTSTTQMTTLTTDQTSTTTEQTATEQTTTTETTSQTSQLSTETSTMSTTENNQEISTETNSSTDQECPDVDEDQSLYVCPTSFRRHPKYCNLFYQCTEDNDNHELKIAVFNCPNNTIYDESKVQCVEEAKSNKKCNGQIAQKHRVKRLGAAHYDPFIVTKESMACRSTGHFPFEKYTKCSSTLLKCEITESGKLRGYVYRCPEGFIYWTISRRCERKSNVRDCKRSSYPWKRRYDIPLERFNIAP